MSLLPHRITLVTQVAGLLRKGIAAGEWTQHLPGEMELCRAYQVSRTTLRAALELLEREGWVSASQGRRRQVLKQGETAAQPQKKVMLLAAMPLEQMGGAQVFLVDALREQLARDGLELELYAGAACFSRKPEMALERLVRGKPAAAWALLSCPAATQRWFMQRGLPCVLVGSPHPGIELPSLDTDFQALGQHAARQFLCRGHRSLAVLMAASERAGDALTVAGFREACVQVEGARMRVIGHDGRPEGIRQALEAALRKAAAPTALLVVLPAHVLTAAGCLARLGLRVPEDVALIARDSEPYLDFMLPAPARYHTSAAAVARKLSRLVLALARHEAVPPRTVLLMPRFLAGATLG